MRAALAMGPSRLGHGVRAIEDPALVKELAQRKITLEVNYTSNVQSKSFADAADHPFRRLFDAGVHVTVNTDNRTISGITLMEEIRRIRRRFGFSEQDIDVMQEYAKEAAFGQL